MTGTTETVNTTAGAGSVGPCPDGLFSLLVATSQQLTVRYPKKDGAFERIAQLYVFSSGSWVVRARGVCLTCG